MAENPAAAAGQAASRGVGNIGRFLNARQFGMPRWVFLALLAGGAGLGLYLRRRSSDDPTELDGDEEVLATDPLSLDEAGMYDPGLAGAGYVPGPPAGSVVPVESPFLPEGVGDIFSGVADILDSLNPDAFNPDPDPGDPPPTGGGPPGRRGNRVVGVITKEERRKLPQEVRAEARKAGRRGVTRNELRDLVTGTDTRRERRAIRRAVRRGPEF